MDPAEDADGGTFGADRGKRIDHGGCRRRIDSRFESRAAVAYDFSARPRASDPDGFSAVRRARRRGGAAGLCTFAETGPGHGSGVDAGGGKPGWGLARSRHLPSTFGAGAVAEVAPRGATPLRAAFAGALGHTPAPFARVHGHAHRVVAPPRSAQGARG